MGIAVALSAAASPNAHGAAPATPVSLSSTSNSAPTPLTLTQVTTTTVEVGSAVEFSGTAQTKLSGLTVSLMRRDSKKSPWLKVGSSHVDSDGAFEVTGKAGKAGTNTWRAVIEDNRVRPARKYTSPSKRTTVYGWYFLTDRDPVDDHSQTGSYPMEISLTSGGKRFPRSMVFGSYTSSWEWNYPSWAEYNLSYRCLTLKASLGIDDGSETGTNATFFVSVDGARSAVGTLGLGPAAEISVDVSNSLRIRLEGVPNSRDLYGRGGFGDPQVLCKAAP